MRDTAAAEQSTPAATAGRDQLLEALYDKHATALVGYLLSLTGGDRHWAEDVTQETLLRAWRNAGRLAEFHTGAWPWLVHVARRIVIDDRRKRDRRPAEVGDALLEHSPCPDVFGPTLDSLLMADALSSLTAAHRETLILVYYRGQTIRQAADALGLPDGTVRSRVHYGLRNLRLALQERGAIA